MIWPWTRRRFAYATHSRYRTARVNETAKVAADRILSWQRRVEHDVGISTADQGGTARLQRANAVDL